MRGPLFLDPKITTDRHGHWRADTDNTLTALLFGKPLGTPRLASRAAFAKRNRPVAMDHSHRPQFTVPIRPCPRLSVIRPKFDELYRVAQAREIEIAHLDRRHHDRLPRLSALACAHPLRDAH